MTPVMVDSSAWIDYLRRGTGRLRDVLDELLTARRAALCGVVELELLQGIRASQRDELADVLKALPYIPTERSDFIVAGDRLAALRRAGFTVPATDGLIAVLCIRHGLQLLTLDSHFTHFDELHRLEI